MDKEEMEQLYSVLYNFIKGNDVPEYFNQALHWLGKKLREEARS